MVDIDYVDVRPEHEIYIGNYPANYTEAQVRDLFSSFSIEIGQIRMKCDGHKV
jgi:RNA recognition motif-containing protein